METAWVRSLRHGYGAAIDQIDELLRLCPEAMWEESLFEVRREQPFVWPVRRAGEREYPDEATQEQLLQVHSAFWNVAGVAPGTRLMSAW